MRGSVFAVTVLGTLMGFACGGESGDPTGLDDDGNGGGSSAISGGLPSDIATSKARFTSWLLVDVDRDGDLDLVGGRSVASEIRGASDVVLLNDGSGRFTELANALPSKYLGTEGETVEIASADLNQDGAPDLVTLVADGRAGSFYRSGQMHLFLNNGNGTFSDATRQLEADAAEGGWYKWADFADFDGDGDLDMVVPAPSWDITSRIYWNDGGGNMRAGLELWTDSTLVLGYGRWSIEMTFPGDIDNDGDVDIVGMSAGFDPEGQLGAAAQWVFRNRGDGSEDPFTVEVFGADMEGIPDGVVLDVNGDGFVDIVSRSGIGAGGALIPLRVLLNDGAGSFADASDEALSPSGLGTVHARDWEVADFNGDGRPDVFVADHGHDVDPFPGAPNRLLVASAAGQLVDQTESRFPAAAENGFTHSVTSGDIDGDGDVDLFLGDMEVGADGGAKLHPAIYLNDGSGRFTRMR